MKKIFLFFCFASVLFLYSHAGAAAITCPDTADVYIDQCLTCSPPGGDINFNNKTRVLVSYHPTKGIAHSLLKFDIPAGITASQIQTATLYLSGSGHTGGGNAISVSIHALSSPFDENTETWNTHSGGDYDASVFSSGAVPAGVDWKTSIDVTTLVTGNLNRVRDNGILIKLATEGPAKLSQSIASRECDNPANPDYVESDEPPRLEIAYPAAASTTTTTIAPSTTSTTTTAALCPVVKIFNSENSREVTVIRSLRNRRMAQSIDGLVLIYLYYTNAEELTGIFSADQELANSAARLIRELTPGLELSLAQNTEMAVTQEQYAESIAILRQTRDEASPGLRRTIDRVLKKLASGEMLKVMGISIQDK